jgi:hypothetical protein
MTQWRICDNFTANRLLTECARFAGKVVCTPIGDRLFLKGEQRRKAACGGPGR